MGEFRPHVDCTDFGATLHEDLLLGVGWYRAINRFGAMSIF